MSPQPTERAGAEPSDLSELTATDALLDRLGARLATAADMSDPAVAALVELLSEIDEVPAPTASAARLVEVLDGRPLYIAPAEGTPAERAADVNTLVLGPVPAEPIPVVDLSGRGKRGHGPGPFRIDQPADRPAAALEPARPGPAGVFVPAARVGGEVLPVPYTGAALRGRALRLLMPAASVVALLALGSGISAAVTGDPMTPVNGISRVMAQIPVVSQLPVVQAAGRRQMADQVRGEISAADRAAAVQDARAARLHLDAARRGLDAVTDSDAGHLQKMINNVQTKLSTVPASPPAVPPVPGVTPTTAPTSAAPPVASTTSAPADPHTSAGPTLEPQPPTTVSVPVDVPPSVLEGAIDSPPPSTSAP